jgi:tRNA modification GTPase
VAIIGPANVGKSSLLNAMVRRDAAIVATTAGTTRDVIEVCLDLGGYPVVLCDTAGLRDSGDAVEREGVARARARAASADFKLLVLDAACETAPEAGILDLMDSETLVIINKIDLIPQGAAWAASVAAHRPLEVSVRTGAGLDRLLAALGARVSERFRECGAVPLTRQRHRRALEECVAALDRAAERKAEELVAEDLRLAVRAVARITGRVGVEDVLDVIFRDFCIGK